MSKGSKERPRLGRGLSSLMSVADHHPAASPPPSGYIVRTDDEVQESLAEHRSAVREWLEIPLDEIVPNPHQPRRHFAEQPLRELAASIKATGLVQPIVVRRSAGGYELIAGERRWRAAKLAQLPSLPAIVRDVDAIGQAQMALVENVHREGLNPIERAEAYHRLIEQLGLTQSELAGRLGEDRSTIANHLRLLDLIPVVREDVIAGTLSFGHAKLLAGVGTPEEQQRLANLVVSQGLSVRNLERLVTQLPPAPAPKPEVMATPHLLDLEKRLAGQLGMRVQVRTAAAKGQGRLILHYSSLDQFDDLLNKLGVLPDE